MVITDCNRQSLQEDLHKISEWPDKWEMPFNVNKSHILQLGTRNHKYEYERTGVKLESVQCVKDLGVTITSNLKFSQHCKDIACKDNRMLGLININFSFKTKNIILPMYVCLATPHIILPMYVSLARPHMEYVVQFWSSHHAKNITKLEAVQHKAIKMIMFLHNRFYKETLV